jgi:hypothetical protein
MKTFGNIETNHNLYDVASIDLAFRETSLENGLGETKLRPSRTETQNGQKGEQDAFQHDMYKNRDLLPKNRMVVHIHWIK